MTLVISGMLKILIHDIMQMLCGLKRIDVYGTNTVCLFFPDSGLV